MAADAFLPSAVYKSPFLRRRTGLKSQMSPIVFPRPNVPGNFSGSSLPAAIISRHELRGWIKKNSCEIVWLGIIYPSENNQLQEPIKISLKRSKKTSNILIVTIGTVHHKRSSQYRNRSFLSHCQCSEYLCKLGFCLSNKIHGSICREILEQCWGEIWEQICKNYCVNICVVSIGSFVGGRWEHSPQQLGYKRYFRLAAGGLTICWLHSGLNIVCG